MCFSPWTDTVHLHVLDHARTAHTLSHIKQLQACIKAMHEALLRWVATRARYGSQASMSDWKACMGAQSAAADMHSWQLSGPCTQGSFISMSYLAHRFPMPEAMISGQQACKRHMSRMAAADTGTQPTWSLLCLEVNCCSCMDESRKMTWHLACRR